VVFVLLFLLRVFFGRFICFFFARISVSLPASVFFKQDTCSNGPGACLILRH